MEKQIEVGEEREGEEKSGGDEEGDGGGGKRGGDKALEADATRTAGSLRFRVCVAGSSAGKLVEMRGCWSATRLRWFGD
jgi:hypothetical protein